MSKQIEYFLIIISFLLVGCNWQSAQINRYPQIIKTWNGHHIDELIEKWGYPQQSFIAENGNKVYIYSREADYTTPIWTTPVTNFTIYGGETTTFFCTTFFEINNNETIVNGNYEGNACN